MTWLQLTVLFLATWRISSLFVLERGPFSIFRNIRRAVGAGEFGGETYNPSLLSPSEMEEAVKKMVNGQSFLGELLSCLWCFSMWVGIGLSVLLFVNPNSIWLMLPFAASAIAIFMNSVITNGVQRS